MVVEVGRLALKNCPSSYSSNQQCIAFVSRRSNNSGTRLLRNVVDDLEFNSGSGSALKYSALLRECTRLHALEEGKRIHNHIINAGLHGSLGLGNLLINFYVKNNDLEDAQRVFDEMKQRDLVSWTSMIGGYAYCGFVNEAFETFRQMQDGGFKPNRITFISIISACCLLPKGRLIHSIILTSGVKLDLILENSLINMYGKCGCLEDACTIFNRVPRKDIITWNSIIASFSQQSHCKGDLLLHQMQLEDMKPNKVTFLNILTSSSVLEMISIGTFIHSCIIKSGIEFDVVIGNALISMYDRCGSIEDASHVFSIMPKQDIISWNTVIAAYAQHGCSWKALDYYEQLPQERMAPNKVTFLAVIDACAFLATHARGKLIHVCILHKGLGMDVAVVTALLNMYAKYESLQEARKIFNSMPHQDPIAWNAIIAAYAQNGHNKAALQLFYQMRKKSWNPSQSTITSIVGLCSTAEDLAEGKLVHAYIIGNGYLVDSTVGSALVNMYGYCGVLEEAIRVFQKLDHHSTPLYSSLIIAYSLQRQDKDSIKLFHEMRQQCGELNKAACFHVLNECSLLVEGKLIHAYIIANKDESHVIIEMALIGMYGRCGSLDNSFRVFSYLENCNVIVWNELMAASLQNKKGENALQTFQQLLAESVEPNVVTFVHVLNACSSTMDFREGILVHSFIITSRVAPDVLVWNCIINMYCNSGSIEDVRRTFKQSPQHNVASWNILMASCIQHESDEEAIQLFRQMQESGIEPNRSTFVTVLNACSNLAALTEGVMVHLQINSSTFCSEVAVGNALIQMYGKCGSLHDACIVFTEMPFRDVASWNTIIGSYGQHGYGDKVLQFFLEMVKTGIEPSAITFVSVLSALNHSGMVDHGHHYFVSMSLDYGLVPIAEHYCCLVDLLARAWRLDEAEDFISKMPFQPGAEAWRALLRSYRKLVVK